MTIGRNEQSFQLKSSNPKTNPWADFWKEKKINNNEFLIAAETGDLETLK